MSPKKPNHRHGSPSGPGKRPEFGKRPKAPHGKPFAQGKPPTHGKPAHGKPAHGKPAFGKPAAHGKPAPYAKPHGKPAAHGKSTAYGKPYIKRPAPAARVEPQAPPAPRSNEPRSNLERIFGTHSVRAVLLARPRAVRRMIIAGEEEYHRDLLDLAAEKDIVPEFIAWPEFLRLGGFTREEKHQGIFILAEQRRIYGESDFELLEDARCVLALDQISNPQNFATILRNAAFFGADAVLILRNRSVEVSSEVVRYAVGGAEFVKVFRVVNLSQSLDALREMGFSVVGLDERGPKTLSEFEFPQKVVVAVGAEGEGLRQKTKTYCDALVRIPGGRTGVESLNAGVATAVALAEIFRAPPV